jgi:hypothetical protein
MYAILFIAGFLSLVLAPYKMVADWFRMLNNMQQTIRDDDDDDARDERLTDIRTVEKLTYHIYDMASHSEMNIQRLSSCAEKLEKRVSELEKRLDIVTGILNS